MSFSRPARFRRKSCRRRGEAKVEHCTVHIRAKPWSTMSPGPSLHDSTVRAGKVIQRRRPSTPAAPSGTTQRPASSGGSAGPPQTLGETTQHVERKRRRSESVVCSDHVWRKERPRSRQEGAVHADSIHPRSLFIVEASMEMPLRLRGNRLRGTWIGSVLRNLQDTVCPQLALSCARAARPKRSASNM